MSAKPTAPKNIPWRTVAAEDWDKGCPHVARLMGVTAAAAYTARAKLMSGRRVERRRLPVPPELQPLDSPADVVRRHGVSLPTAKKWLRSVGRAPAPTGRPRRG